MNQLRRQRIGAVQTAEQYIFIYEAIKLGLSHVSRMLECFSRHIQSGLALAAELPARVEEMVHPNVFKAAFDRIDDYVGEAMPLALTHARISLIHR